MILHDLRDTNSTIAKKALLPHSTDTDKKVFKYSYDLRKSYYLKFSSIDWDSIFYEGSPEMFTILDALSSRQLSGTLARVTVEDHAAKYGDLIKLICNKDLDCGITATTLNSVFGRGFIPQFKLQGAIKVPIHKVPLPTIAQIKYNGARMVVILSSEGVVFKSRGGHTFEFPRLKEAFVNREGLGKDIVIEGELAYGDSRYSNHTKVSGLINSSIRGTPIIDKDLVFTAFDTMSLEHFDKNECSLEYIDRFTAVARFVQKISSSSVQLAKCFEINSTEELEKLFNTLLATGYEGLILKQASSKYTFKKNKNWIKLKNEDTVDLLCTDTIDGKDSFEGGIGSLVCEGVVYTKDASYNINVNVSSGLTNSQRFENVNNYLGKHIEISYNDIIQDSKTKKWSLFIPKFILVREDKI